MIYGIGVDIVVITRFQSFLDNGNQRILNRLFTESERNFCSQRNDTASCFSARFAAKEAFLKALGTGLRNGISWQDLEISNNQLGKPEIIIFGKAAEICLNNSISKSFLSLSHDGGNAVAMVVLETV